MQIRDSIIVQHGINCSPVKSSDDTLLSRIISPQHRFQNHISVFISCIDSNSQNETIEKMKFFRKEEKYFLSMTVFYFILI